MEEEMISRRIFVTQGIGSFLSTGILLSPFFSAIRWAWAASRRALVKGTTRESLINEDPAALDATNLEITPLKDFGTMGPTDQVVDRARWHLEVSGQVKRTLRFTYAELTALPSIERSVLLICPGFFANHGLWKGVSINGLLQQADFERTARQVVIQARGGKIATFPLADILSDKVFLAYQVNGEDLPRKHGFPLRVVAEDSFGSEWIKYVDKVSVVRP
jgi:DMSO/TMAO reductase YedYZ molybdopterin-dependent catalytic subunit